MKNQALTNVETMFTNLAIGDVPGLQQPLSEGSVWIYHNVKNIPYSGQYHGKDNIAQFATSIGKNVDIEYFIQKESITEDNTAVVADEECPCIKTSDKVPAQKWIQIYIIEHGKTVRIEEVENVAHVTKMFCK